MRTHYISTDDAKEIAERAKERRASITTKGGVDAQAEQADHLADIAAVLGDQPRMRTVEVLQRLAQTNPRVYTGKDAQWLAQLLRDAGAPTYLSNGYPSVSRDKVLAALAERDEDQ